MNLFITFNNKTDLQIDNAKKVISSLMLQGYKCFMSLEDSNCLFNNDNYYKDFKECDLIVSIGGDGAVLKAAQIAIFNNLPLLGINAGRLGYLCAIKAEKIINGTKLNLDKYNIEYRSILEANINNYTYYALNDFVFSKSNFGSSISLILNCKTLKDIKWRGDGLIVSTPTGSTSYSYASVGPYVDPNVNVFIITPICPHFGSNKSIILNDNEPITISSEEADYYKPSLYCDGKLIGNIDNSINIKISSKKLKLYTDPESFNYNKITQSSNF